VVGVLKPKYYILEVGVGAETWQSLHPSLHFLQGQPKILTRVDIPTSKYTTAARVPEPRIRPTTFRSEPISIPTPTRPQFIPPTRTKTQATFEQKHLHLQLHDI
jgi:hypothetical protein